MLLGSGVGGWTDIRVTTMPLERPDLRHSPLQARHVALGAKMADFGGWEMPIEYSGGGVLKEHAAVREAVGVFDVSHLGKVSVAGGGAAEFVNSVLTNDLARIEPGQAQYSMLCNAEGGVIDDLVVYLRADDDVLLVPNAANAASVFAVLRDRLSGQASSGVEVRNRHLEFGVVAVQGPESATVMSQLGLPSVIDRPDLDYMSFVDTTWNSAPVVVCRSGYTGEHGYEVLVPWDLTGALWDELLSAIEPFAGRPVGLAARDTLRTEMGYPLHGQDLGPAITPLQARSGWAVGWDKPQFDGREALLAQRSTGAARLLRGLRATDRGIPRPHMQVSTNDGLAVGELTSGTFSPTLRQGVGLALLDRSVSDGDSVNVDVRGRVSVMEVVRPPFVPSHVR
jgi:aminomethyltransferase